MKVLITGAAGGIGSAAAAAFENAGHSVLRHDVRAGSAIDISGNLLDPTTLATLAQRCQDEGIDAVAAAHGLSGPGDLSSIATADIVRTMRVNTSSVIALYEALAPQLHARRGVFVAVSSQAGLEGEAGNAIYCASKFALVGWARGLAGTARAPRLRVLCPGMTETPLLTDGLKGMAASLGLTYEEFLEHRLSTVPVGRVGRPAELGRAAVWLTEIETQACVIAAITGGATYE
jgi:2-keto-3-deoxy-L-fuconate dehydrogenase